MPPVFKPRNTEAIGHDEPTKTLVVAHHGFGKTTQCGYMQDHFGPGFIISGESGLKSIADKKIDYLHFNSWDERDEEGNSKDTSFKGIVKLMSTQEFRDAGYKWIAIDSLTEMSDQCYRHFEAQEMRARMQDPDKKKDGFAVWNNYNSAIIGALKWVRDLNYHVLVTCLAAEETDENGAVEYWPSVQGRKIAKQIPGMFDNVLCGVRASEMDPATNRPRISRQFITDEFMGWRGKVRDPFKRVDIVEKTSNLCDILEKISKPKED